MSTLKSPSDQERDVSEPDATIPIDNIVRIVKAVLDKKVSDAENAEQVRHNRVLEQAAKQLCILELIKQLINLYNSLIQEQ